jgi:hypothetical protein
MSRFFCLLAVVLMGCKDEAECKVGDLGEDVAQATVDGAEWAASGGTWGVAGSGIQVSMESASQVMLNLAAKRDDGGDGVADAIEAGDFPIIIDLGGTDGHGGVFDGRNSPVPYVSNETGGSGTMTISGVSGDDKLSGCFEFDAIANDGGSIMEVREGRVKIGQ